MSNQNPPFGFNIAFDPTKILKDAEDQMRRAFEGTINSEIRSFVSENSRLVGNKVVVNEGAGLLLIRDFLEKKFDDPKTHALMETFFAENFERIMAGAMEKALQHKANAFAFHHAKNAAITAKN